MCVEPFIALRNKIVSVRYVLPYISSQKLVHDSCILAMYIL